MSDRIEINELLDQYGGLLTPRQQTIANDYFREDLSLQEIAELENVSRAAVYDMIRRCREDLYRYESILHTVRKSKRRKELYQRILEDEGDHLRMYIEECMETEGGEYD